MVNTKTKLQIGMDFEQEKCIASKGYDLSVIQIVVHDMLYHFIIPHFCCATHINFVPRPVLFIMS